MRESFKRFLGTFLLVVNIISFVLTLVLGAIGVYAEIVGPGNFINQLEFLNINMSYDQFLIVGYICTAVTIITYIALSKIKISDE
ncbi:MAG: hypothetical protein E7546_07075 [Ruminococcaceae bacterium]|nr:hypothetical protein [Oscillospiraceae bacterium]